MEERPVIVDIKERFGDLEINIVIGSNHKWALVTINNRLTSKVWIRKLSWKDAALLTLKTIEALQPIKDLIHRKQKRKAEVYVSAYKLSFYFR